MKISIITALAIIFFIPFPAKSQELKSLSSTSDLDELFSSFKGKPALVNIWATWCKPCVKEFPDLVKLYNNYKDQGFTLVFISVDDKSDRDTKVVEFLNRNGVDFVSYHNEFKKPEELIDYFDKSWGGEIPATYIYDKEGVMVKKHIGSQSYEKFETEIKEIL